MAIQTNFPALKPTLLLDFANVKALDPRITFTRASEGRYYDGKTFAKAEENLLTRSQEFDNASWSTVDNVTNTANTTTAPDGTTTADTLSATATTATHYTSAGSSVTSGLTYTISVFAKANDTNFLQIFGASVSFGTNVWANFDLSAGTVGSTGSSTTASIVSFGNGWYRCIITGNATATTSSTTAVAFCPINSSTAARNPSFDGTGHSIYIWGAQLEQRSSVTAYTPTTTQPITNYVPVLLTAPAGVARFDHNPTTGESLGLLIEEQRTNLLTRSEEFNDASWVKGNSSVTANTIVAPDGTLTGDKLVEDTANSTHKIQQLQTKAASAIQYTVSIYAKAAERTSCILYLAGTAGEGNSCGATFDLLTGAVSSPVNAGTFTGVSASSVAVGNGWYRLFVTGTSDTATSIYLTLRLRTTTSTYTGDGYSGIFIWGAQLESGGFSTSYIPTVAAQVTRSADAASMTRTNFSSWYRPDEGTLYGESSSSRDTSTRWPFGVDDGSASNVIGVRFTSTQVQNRIFVSAVSQADIVVAHTTGYAKTALGYKFNDVAASVNGGAAGTDTSANIPVVSQFTIGRISGGSAICGHIRKIAFYPARLSDAQLQALTS